MNADSVAVRDFLVQLRARVTIRGPSHKIEAAIKLQLTKQPVVLTEHRAAVLPLAAVTGNEEEDDLKLEQA